jgi:hypothetical protein
MFERIEGERIQRELREDLRRGSHRPEKPPTRAEQILGATSLAAIVAFWYFRGSLSASFSALKEWIIGYTSGLALGILCFAVTIATAISLYLLRSKRRRLYAILEIAFGISASIFAANEIANAPEYSSEFRNLVAAVGGIYIIIRGLDNWFHKSHEWTNHVMHEIRIG